MFWKNKAPVEWRAEAGQINAEIEKDVRHSILILETALPSLIRRCSILCPDNPEISETIRKTIAQQISHANVVLQQCDHHRQLINGTGHADGALVIAKLREMRATAASSIGWSEGIVAKFSQVLDQYERPL